MTNTQSSITVNQPNQEPQVAEFQSDAETKTITMQVNPDLENRFSYHPPKAGQPEKYNDLRETAKAFAYLIDYLCPNSREKSTALTNLEQAVFWANASIARNE